jgi:hypothetical protein
LAKLENVKILDMVNGEPTRVEYNGVIYEKTEESAKAGDLVRVVDDNIGDVEDGEFYELYIDEGDDLVFDDDVDDARPYDSWTNELETFRKVPAQPQPDLVERIAELERRIAALEGRGNGAVAEDQPKYRKVTDRYPRVGDYVKFDEAPCSYLTAGKYYEIVEIDDFGDPQIIDDDGDEFDTYDFEFEVYELVSEGATKFEVGDYAKVISVSSAMRGFVEGDIVKVIGVNGCGYDTEIENENGTVGFGNVGKHIVPATDEEIRWAKIGRKPGEFKQGDIVRVIKNHPHGSEKRIGDIDEITYLRNPHSFCVGEGLGWMGCSDVELICPAERRFDREGVNV